MAIRFRKSIKLAPGVRMNLSGGGLSWTLGPRGASIGIGKRGTYLNAGIPGTGAYTRQALSSGSRSARQSLGDVPAHTKRVSLTVAVSDDGDLTFTDEAGAPISEELIEAAKKQRGEAIRALIQKKCDEINAQVEALGRCTWMFRHPISDQLTRQLASLHRSQIHQDLDTQASLTSCSRTGWHELIPRMLLLKQIT